MNYNMNNRQIKTNSSEEGIYFDITYNNPLVLKFYQKKHAEQKQRLFDEKYGNGKNRKNKTLTTESRLWWAWPTWICLPTAVITSLSTFPERLEKWWGFDFYFSHPQETKELFIAFFILLFIWSLKRRLKLLHNSQPAATDAEST